jgi:hypothetical protein
MSADQIGPEGPANRNPMMAGRRLVVVGSSAAIQAGTHEGTRNENKRPSRSEPREAEVIDKRFQKLAALAVMIAAANALREHLELREGATGADLPTAAMTQPSADNR